MEHLSVLVVDDEEFHLEDAAEDLLSDSKNRWNVYRASSQKDLDAILKSQRPIDIAIIDVRLALDQGFSQTGFEIAEMLLQKRIKVGMTTSSLRDKDFKKAHALGIPIFDTASMIVGRQEAPYLKIVDEIIKDSVSVISREGER